MKMALVQQSAAGSRETNLERGLAAVRTAAKQGASLVAFAELAFDRFHPRCRCVRSRLDLAEPIPGPTTERFAALARELGVVIVLNLYEREGSRAFDASPVIDADGRLLGVTRMLHITDYEGFHERDYYEPGDRGLPVHETAAGRIGVAICYDRHFPEAMRALALAGAELVVVPQAGTVGEWPDGLYEAELRVAAFQNGYFTALVNRVGKEESLEFSGESFVCAPDGTVLARGGLGTEETVFAEVDLSECVSSHARRLFFPDRRPELYRRWFEGDRVAR